MRAAVATAAGARVTGHHQSCRLKAVARSNRQSRRERQGEGVGVCRRRCRLGGVSWWRRQRRRSRKDQQLTRSSTEVLEHRRGIYRGACRLNTVNVHMYSMTSSILVLGDCSDIGGLFVLLVLRTAQLLSHIANILLGQNEKKSGLSPSYYGSHIWMHQIVW